MITEITDISVSCSGKRFRGKMYNVSAKLIFKDDLGEVILEQSFSEKHKDIYNIKDTMDKIRVQMDIVIKKLATELALKTEAEKEVPAMLTNLKEKK